MFDSFKNLMATGGGLAAGFAILVASWNYIKIGWKYFVGLFIGKTILKDEAGQAAMAFAFAKSIRSPLGMKIFGGHDSYIHPKKWNETIAYESIGSDPVLIKYKKQFALLSLGGNDVNGSNSIGRFGESCDIVCIRYFRWFFDVEQFVMDSVEYLNDEKRQKKLLKSKSYNKLNRFKIIRNFGKTSGKVVEAASDGIRPSNPSETDSGRIDKYVALGIYRLLKWKREDLQYKVEEGKSPFDGYPFPDEVGFAIEELDAWLSNEQWFRSKSIPWRRGWLLHGQPGTGKSTLVRSLGMSFDLPVFIFDLSSMNNMDLYHSWEDMMSHTPCIALIEDIDAVFNGREYVGSISPNIPHLTFDCLLNCISGVKQADGIFLIVTTNHIDKLDSAIGVPDKNGTSSRPGRIDKVIHLGPMQEPQRKMLANHILSDYPDLIEDTVKLGEGETAAQFQSRCAQLALDRFWKSPIKRQIPENIEVMSFKPVENSIRHTIIKGSELIGNDQGY